jgi:hypothetical protein
VNVADHFVGIHEVVADGGMGKELTLSGLDDIGRRRNETAGLAFEGKVLRL